MPFSAEQLLARYPLAVLSHESAALIHGLDLLGEPATNHLTVPRNHSRIAHEGWRVHRVSLHPMDRVGSEGFRLTSPLRTVVDLARASDATSAVLAADSAMRLRLVGEHALRSVLETCRGPGSSRCRRVEPLLDARAGSALETLLRLVLLAAGLVGFTAQEVIRDRAGSFVARVDFCWRDSRLVVEADGFAFHSERAQYRRDRQRMNELERLGWRVLRFTYEDVLSRPDHVVDLVRACLATAAA